jgi:ribulose-phosphate 3-epimerase
MNTIVPAIIPTSFDHLRETYEVVKSFARELQIDVVDGRFVPFTSWPYRGSGSVMLLREFAEHMILEVDLMIASPEDALPLYVDAGVQKVVVHLESVTDLERILGHRSSHDYELGFSIRNDTPLEVLTDVIHEADYVQLMGIRDIGSQGQQFDREVLTRIRVLRTSYPELTISIDGSVNRETLPLLRNEGANRFVSGSAILGADEPSSAYELLTAL